MKLLMENWRKFLKEAADEMKSRIQGLSDEELQHLLTKHRFNPDHPEAKAAQEEATVRFKGAFADATPEGGWAQGMKPTFPPEDKGGNELVKQAFANTDQGHLALSRNRKTPGHDLQTGSVFSRSVSIEELINASWESYPHPAITSPAIGFKTSIPGILGVAKITDPGVPEEIMFQPAHGGKAMTKEPNPETGQLEVLAEIVGNIPEERRSVKHTTLLIGPSREDPKKLQVWTFHPGDPTPQLPEITMRQVQKRYNTKETQIRGSKQEAIEMGYGFVKHAEI